MDLVLCCFEFEIFVGFLVRDICVLEEISGLV